MSNSRRFNYEEYREISNHLEDKHAIFNKFYSMIRPVFTDKISTAAVAFNKLGDCVDFMVNPDFWDKCNFQRKLFVISHECLHVILSHGSRGSNIPKGEQRIANVAMDLVVNYLLVDRFGFDREQIDPIAEYDDPKNPGQKLKDPNDPSKNLSGRMFCWLDTILPDKVLEEDRSFEYYFNVLKENAQICEGDSFDDHDGLDSFDDGDDFEKKFRGKLKELSDQELQSLKDLFEKKEMKKGSKDGEEPANGQQAGNRPGGFWKTFNVEKTVYKKKWETIIKNWCRSALTSIEIEQWARTPRRMANVSSNVFLPSDMEIEEAEKHKIDVMLFLDTSGSCAHLAERFIKAVRGIPPHRFNVKAFCFDTDTYEMDIKTGKLSGFGGTCFRCIDQRVREEVQKTGKHPGAVFVITDGMGTPVNPEQPKKWHWLLSEQYLDCIPSDCLTYDLNKFE